VSCIRGAGSTAYANAIEAAQAELDRSGRPDAPDIIVMLSDGAANTGPTYYPSGSSYRTQPCNQGVRSAATIKAKKTVVYTIGYDLDATAPGTNVCKNGVTNAAESPAITAYSAIQQMASPGNFYNHPSPTDLSAIFQAIAFDINEGKSRLFD
jgi:hypothetical protein